MKKIEYLNIKPRKFISADIASSVDNQGAVEMSSIMTIDSAKVVGIRGLDNNGNLIECQDPGTSPMFLLKVKPRSKSTSLILTDGTLYYPIKGNKHFRVSDTFDEDSRPYTAIDQLGINEAVRRYAVQF